MFQIVIKYFSFQGPPNFTQIGIFGLKTNHLATLGHTNQKSENEIRINFFDWTNLQLNSIFVTHFLPELITRWRWKQHLLFYFKILVIYIFISNKYTQKQTMQIELQKQHTTVL
jgi:hypothetical protein